MALFPPAPGGGREVDHGYKGKGTTLHLVVDKEGAPLWITSTSAKGDERPQALNLMDRLIVNQVKDIQTVNICEADKGYDSDDLRAKMFVRGFFPIIGFRKNRRFQESTKSIAEKIGISRRRWVVERTFAWLKRKCRRLLMRWERLPEVWNAFALLGLIYMWLENLVG